tara:strand:+ start:265 stop:474 length:210 start_codon:yes stop_codon:yes gene_type:complete
MRATCGRHVRAAFAAHLALRRLELHQDPLLRRRRRRLGLLVAPLRARQLGVLEAQRVQLAAHLPTQDGT